MYGAVEFYRACQAAGIKPIIGIEAYVAPQSRLSRDRDDGKIQHLVLLAQNQTGYSNLLQLASIAQLEGFYYKPRIDKEVLETYSEGVIALSACVQGEIPQLLHQGQDAQARDAVRWYLERFPGSFYLELQSHDIPEYDEVYRKLVVLSQRCKFRLSQRTISTMPSAPRLMRTTSSLHGTGKTSMSQPMRMTDNSYDIAPEECGSYGEIPDALLNTVALPSM